MLFWPRLFKLLFQLSVHVFLGWTFMMFRRSPNFSPIIVNHETQMGLFEKQVFVVPVFLSRHRIAATNFNNAVEEVISRLVNEINHRFMITLQQVVPVHVLRVICGVEFVQLYTHIYIYIYTKPQRYINNNILVLTNASGPSRCSLVWTSKKFENRFKQCGHTPVIRAEQSA